MSDHTAGEWTIGNGPGRHNADMVYTNADNLETSDGICQVYGITMHQTLEEVEKDGGSREGLANARLIAASPNLLAACELAYERMMQFAEGSPELSKVLLDAIYKARTPERAFHRDTG